MALLALTQFGGQTFANTVTFRNPVTISADADVLTLGTAKYAAYYSLNSSGNVDLSGVSFTAITNIAGDGNMGFSGMSTAFNGYNANGTYFSALTPPYKKLLTGGVYNSGTAATASLNNLTVGRVYAVQVFVNESRYVTSGNEFMRDMNVTSTGGNTVNLKYNTQQVAGGVGQFALGTFVADATSQSFTLNAGTAATSKATQVNAMQLRDVTDVVGIWTGVVDGSWNSTAATGWRHHWVSTAVRRSRPRWIRLRGRFWLRSWCGHDAHVRLFDRWCWSLAALPDVCCRMGGHGSWPDSARGDQGAAVVTRGLRICFLDAFWFGHELVVLAMDLWRHSNSK